MRTTTIKLDYLGDYMKLERAYQRLAVGLLHYKNLLEAQHKLLKNLNTTAQFLHDHKDSKWWNTLTPEVRKEIEKYGKWGIRK